MALLNVSTCSSELPPKPSLSPQQTSPFPPTPPSLRRLSCAPGADLSDADLRALDFSLANVTKANMSNPNLEGADATGNTSFKRSNIMGVDFTDVPLREDQREYLRKVVDR
ncbi:unnamed protein product [Malus baccata var. baccata]